MRDTPVVRPDPQKAVHQRFCAFLARKYPGTIWKITHREECLATEERDREAASEAAG
jgi:hypothetical protein